MKIHHPNLTNMKPMTKFLSKCIVVTISTIGVLLPGMLTAAVIVFDGFDGGANGASITGRTPSGTDAVNLPGGTWLRATGQASLITTTSGGFGDPLPGAAGGSQGASAISIATAGSYTKPNTLVISADIAPRNSGGNASGGRGAALGFFSTVGTSQEFSSNRFTGLVLDAAGNLNLVHDPNASGFFGTGSVRDTPIAFVGTWDSNALRQLSYEVNTITGEISNISLEGSTASYSFTTNLFTDSNTAYAGMYTSSNVSSLGAFDNFQVAAIPEPGTCGLLSMGLAGLLLRRRRKV